LDSEFIVGIDLGTTNSALAFCERAGGLENTRIEVDALAPRISLALEPCIEGGLRFFKERDAMQSSLLSRAPGQLSCFLIERGRHGEQNVLLRQAMVLCVRPPMRVPRSPEVLQVTR